MAYIGVPPFGQTVRTVTEITATAAQTTFNPTGGYPLGYVDVYLNGVALGSADFVAANGVTVVLNAAASSGDEFKSIAYWPVELVSQAETGGGATGGGTDQVFVENDQIVSFDYTLTANKNASSTGPITVNSGVSVTVPSGSRWVVI
jgi:hypothetical protein